MSTSTNVSTGKPKIGGAISVAPTGTTLPTDATTALDAAFKNLGYVSEDGLSETASIDSSEVKAWGGDTVLNNITGTAKSFKYQLLEVLSVDVLKHVFGDSAVTGDLSTGISIADSGINTAHMSIVFDMILNGGVLKRIVVPDCSISDLGEVSYTDADAVAYEVTVSAVKDATGQYTHQYIKKSA